MPLKMYNNHAQKVTGVVFRCHEDENNLKLIFDHSCNSLRLRKSYIIIKIDIASMDVFHQSVLMIEKFVHPLLFILFYSRHGS